MGPLPLMKLASKSLFPSCSNCLDFFVLPFARKSKLIVCTLFVSLACLKCVR